MWNYRMLLVSRDIFFFWRWFKIYHSCGKFLTFMLGIAVVHHFPERKIHPLLRRRQKKLTTSQMHGKLALCSAVRNHSIKKQSNRLEKKYIFSILTFSWSIKFVMRMCQNRRAYRHFLFGQNHDNWKFIV